MQEVILTSFIFINTLTFIVYGIDKWFSLKKHQRISERELHTFSLIGGFLGATLSMAIFSHKTNKAAFLIKHILIILVWIIAIIFYLKQIM